MAYCREYLNLRAKVVKRGWRRLLKDRLRTPLNIVRDHLGSTGVVMRVILSGH
jgi:hypothetical protein